MLWCSKIPTSKGAIEPMAVFEKDQLATSYMIEGEGPTVVLIHGVGARLENWDGVCERLVRHFQVLRYDLRGHGRSTRSPGPYSLPLLASDLRALFEQTGLRKAHIAGHSLGAMIAQMFCLNYAKCVADLALWRAVAGRTQVEGDRLVARIDAIRRGRAGERVRNAVSRWFSDAYIGANRELLAAYAQRSAENDPDCYLAPYKVLALEDLG